MCGSAPGYKLDQRDVYLEPYGEVQPNEAGKRIRFAVPEGGFRYARKFVAFDGYYQVEIASKPDFSWIDRRFYAGDRSTALRSLRRWIARQVNQKQIAAAGVPA